MLRTIGLLALPRRALSAGSDDGISPAAARLLGGWVLTETGLAPASPTQLIWTHRRHCPTGTACRKPGQGPSSQSPSPIQHSRTPSPAQRATSITTGWSLKVSETERARPSVWTGAVPV